MTKDTPYWTEPTCRGGGEEQTLNGDGRGESVASDLIGCHFVSGCHGIAFPR